MKSVIFTIFFIICPLLAFADGAWSITIKHAEVTDNLSSTEAMVLYDGDSMNVEHSEKPAVGKLFLLADVTVAKVGQGRTTFSWGNLYIKDESGNKYYRHPNDTFLEKYKLPRIKATELKLGSSTGFAVFEVDRKAKKLWLIYSSDDTEINYELKVKR